MTAPTIIDGAVGVDVTQVTSPSTLRFPPFRLGTTVRGSDGEAYVYVVAGSSVSAGAIVKVSDSFTATASAAGEYTSEATIPPGYFGWVRAGVGTRPMPSRQADTFNVKDFGAKGDGVTDDAAAIQEAIDAAGAAGGGRVYAPPGSYYLASITSLSSALVMKANVHLFGAGEVATQFRWFGGDGHLISATEIEDWSIRDMSLHGGRQFGLTATGYHIIRCDTTDRFHLENLFCEDALFYSIGLQNGTITKARIRNIISKNSGSDAIDFKNRAGDANFGLVLDGIIVDGFDLRADGSKAGVDIRGPATLSNIHVKASFSLNSVGIRLRQGEAEDSAGAGGHYSSVSNWYVEDTGTQLGSGVNIVARSAQFGVGTAVNCGTGGWIATEAEDSAIVGAAAFGCGTGFMVEGESNEIQNCRAKDCGTSYRLRGTDNIIRSCRSRGATVRGFYAEPGTVNGQLLDNKSQNDFRAVLDNSTTTYHRGNQGWVNTDETGVQDTRYIGPTFIGASTTLLAVENRLYFVPVSIPWNMLADQVALHVTTGAGDATCQVRMMLYRFWEGVPKELLYDFGVKTLGTGTNTQSIGLSEFPVMRGRYAIGLIFNRNGGSGALPTLGARSTINSVERASLGASSPAFSSTSFADHIYADGTVTGTWAEYEPPAEAPTVTFTNDNVILASFRAT